MKTIPLRLGAILACLTALPSFSADPPGVAGQPTVVELQGLKGSEFEIAFLTNMIHHHMDGVNMAKLVPEKSKDEHLKQMSEKMVADQEAEIAQMKQWLDGWHQKKPEAQARHAAGKQMAEAVMQKLQEAKGEEFDKFFLKTMIKHHQGAVEMSKLVPAKAARAELKELAQKIEAAQAQEIEHMEAMLKQ